MSTWSWNAESQIIPKKGRVLLNCLSFFSPTPSASSPASRQSSPLSLCQWLLPQHRSLYPSLPNQQLSPSLPLFQLASIQPWFKSRFRPHPPSPWWFRRQSQTPPSPLEPSRQQQPVQVPSQRLERQAQRLELLGALPPQAQHPLPAPLLVLCNPLSASAWLAQSLPPSSKQTPLLDLVRREGGKDGPLRGVCLLLSMVGCVWRDIIFSGCCASIASKITIILLSMTKKKVILGIQQ